MSYQLVIAEKPSVARSIAGVIGADKKQDGYMEGNGYLVSWCIGHLVSLADAGAYGQRGTPVDRRVRRGRGQHGQGDCPYQ